jgi:hypothetical protein
MKKGAAYWMDLKQFNDKDPIFLAKVQKGITNFVRILTEKDIPVEYATTGDSMTDGKTVYIASNLKEDTIDYTVGLALHEASHVLLTDFSYLKREKGKLLEVKWNVPKEDLDNVFTLINFVEDKRIDNFIYSTAPGYQLYYEELYRKSFYNKIVDKNLQTDNLTTPTWEAYLFRIINIFNRNSDLSKLPGLQEVRDLLTFKNINELKSTQDSVKVAINIYHIIKPYLQEEEEEKSFNNQEYKTNIQVERQKDFINSQHRKKRISKAQKIQVNKLAQSKTKLNDYNISKNSNIPTIITYDWEHYFTSKLKPCEKAVENGLFLGKKLLSKLQTRNNIRKDVFENQKKGKLNTNKLFKAPFREDIFCKVEKEDYKNTFIHISLDLSGSMRGNKLEKTIQTAVAIAYASCYLKNFDVEISLRGTFSNPGKQSNQTPLLAYSFNSKKNNVKDLNKFKLLTTRGMTPEGICLDEVRKNLPKPSYYQEVFLLNISDGLPNINSTAYNFNTSINHTAKVIRQYKRDNIGVLSYYIHDVWDKTQKSENTFGRMYGKDAKYIDVNNISLVGKTINNMLLSNTIKVF